MMHAKTAVADGHWARVGSTNLNMASWIGNWELDVIAEDERFSQKMENMYLQDLAHSVEIVLREKRKVRPAAERPRIGPSQKTASGSAGRAAAGVLRIGNAVGAAITDHRVLGPAEAKIMFTVAWLLVAVNGGRDTLASCGCGSDRCVGWMGGNFAARKSLSTAWQAQWVVEC